MEDPFCSVYLFLGNHCLGRWGLGACDTRVPRPWAAEWHVWHHEAVPTSAPLQVPSQTPHLLLLQAPSLLLSPLL